MDQSRSPAHRANKARGWQTLITPSDTALLLKGIHSQEPVAGLTHDFYKYPARFSPFFTRAVIETFTQPREVIYDPFLGGGTTVVEASSLGRRALGTDISSLAVFLSEVKTTVLQQAQVKAIRSWIDRVGPSLNILEPAQRAHDWVELGYQRNINTTETWRIRKLVELAVAKASYLKTREEQRFARCVVLKTAQWALDCRKKIPTVKEFRQQFHANATEMLKAATQYGLAVREAAGAQHHDRDALRPLCLHRSAVGIEEDPALNAYRPIKLVLTSPPYPGVHVLYHRWQVKGRRETPAPFWITASLDGQGASYYTFGDRKAQQLNSYFEQAQAAFTSIAKISDRQTLIVQMVAFAEPEWQLERYSAMMENAGFSELTFPQLANSPDGRIWRSVPNRKWYASQLGITASSKEVVLFHKLRPENGFPPRN
jgi:hypothetical protein